MSKIFQHVKTFGRYKLISIGKMENTLESIVVYKCLKTKQVWVRPKNEFFDGRFKHVHT